MYSLSSTIAVNSHHAHQGYRTSAPLSADQRSVAYAHHRWGVSRGFAASVRTRSSGAVGRKPAFVARGTHSPGGPGLYRGADGFGHLYLRTAIAVQGPA